MYVYILASKRNGTLYTGVTSNLTVRIWEHRNAIKSNFATRYRAYNLVYYEVHEIPEAAILREKRIKKWERPWKISLIEQMNPTWRDLYSDLAEP